MKLPFLHDSDKKKYMESFLDFSQLDQVDISSDLRSDLGFEKKLFSRFTEAEIHEMLQSVNVYEVLKTRGYKNVVLSTEPGGDLDNRIFIKTEGGEILVHLRLKVSDFTFKKTGDLFRLVYIDWLLTQNLNSRSFSEKKKLFTGQKYPGLNIMNEMMDFISILTNRLGAQGIFNIPEYFHDAVLFQKKFRFLEPAKEGTFRALIKTFKKINLRDLSHMIHDGNILDLNTGEKYSWQHGEMIYTPDDFMNELFFGSEYRSQTKKKAESCRFAIVGAQG